MQIIETVNALRKWVKGVRLAGHRVALVPTMGALHEGHMALMEEARRHAETVVVSIFVNPKQFGPNEDFATYPRQTEADKQKLIEGGVDLLWLPTLEEIYPADFATTISVAGLPDQLCGATRPGHFDGVSTVVAKLFNQVRPDVAVFGEKDWQQLAIIRQVSHDLDLDVGIIGLATQRASDGLALSSRNAYLSPAERQQAVALPRALIAAVEQIESGRVVENCLASVRAALKDAGFHTIDYVEYVDAVSLQPLAEHGPKGRLLAAAKLGKARLIDNFPVAAR